MEKTTETDSHTHLMSFYRPLVKLLAGMADISLNSTTSPKKMHALCLAVEQIYYTRNLTFIGPFSFSTSLVKWSFHGSKSSHALDGCSYPSGSVTTLQKFLRSSSQDENKCFESGDVEVWAENTQRKGKTSRVREDGTTPISIATNVVFIRPNPVSHIQKIYELSPRHWRNTKENIHSLIRQFEQQLNANIFRPYWHKIQSIILKSLLEESSHTGDSIDKSLNEECDEDLFFCMQCTAANTKTSSLCISCGCQLQTSQNRELMYDVPNGHPKEKPTIKLGEIIGVNPNSYKTIKEVLFNLLQQVKSDERTWVRIGFDGVPYGIAKELIDKVYFCNGCEEIIDLKEDSLETHLLHFHYSDSNISVKPYFGDILLVPGPGHMEKNFLLTIFKFTKDIFMFKLADKLGFKSSKAKDFIINCGDHHLSWQIANIVFDAFAKELMHIFLQFVSGKICNQQLKILLTGAIKKLLIQILIFTTT